jgi:hypothetical protein
MEHQCLICNADLILSPSKSIEEQEEQEQGEGCSKHVDEDDAMDAVGESELGRKRKAEGEVELERKRNLEVEVEDKGGGGFRSFTSKHSLGTHLGHHVRKGEIMPTKEASKCARLDEDDEDDEDIPFLIKEYGSYNNSRSSTDNGATERLSRWVEEEDDDGYDDDDEEDDDDDEEDDDEEDNDEDDDDVS